MVDVDCWCYAVRRQVRLSGEVCGRRAADLLDVNGCSEVDCPLRGAVDCLIGKILEGRWH